MKVLLVSLQKRGGGAFDVFGLSNGLCENRFLHEVIISDANELSGDFIDNDYRRVTKTPTYDSNAKSFFLHSLLLVRPLRFLAAVRKARPSIVHITHFHPWALLVFWARPFLKYKIIYAVHEDPYGRKDDNNPFVMGPLERIFIARADVVATYSDYMKGVLSHEIPEKKIKMILLGAYDTFCPNFIHGGFHEKGTLRVLFFGPIREYKGVDILVNAMALCKKRGVDAELIIAGRQDPGIKIVDENELKGLGIKWVNKFLSREEVGALLAACDVLAIPYKKATQTTPGALAIAYGIPAIGTRTGGLPEQVEDGVNGLLVEPSDVEGLAAAIEKIVNDRSLLKKFSDGAKMLYKTKFNWIIIAGTAINEVYRQELADPSKSLK